MEDFGDLYRMFILYSNSFLSVLGDSHDHEYYYEGFCRILSVWGFKVMLGDRFYKLASGWRIGSSEVKIKAEN